MDRLSYFNVEIVQKVLLNFILIVLEIHLK